MRLWRKADHLAERTTIGRVVPSRATPRRIGLGVAVALILCSVLAGAGCERADSPDRDTDDRASHNQSRERERGVEHEHGDESLARARGSDRSVAHASQRQAPRVAPLSPALAIILRDLGLEDLVVARHGFDLVLDESLPVVGDQTGIDYESLLRVEPTHVLLERGADDPPPTLMRLAEERGWTIERFPLLTLHDIRSATQRLAAMFGGERVRTRAENLLSRMDRVWSPRPELARHAGRTLALYWTRPPGAAGPGSFHHQLLKAVGVSPAIEDGGPYITLDAEDVHRLDPDSLVLFMPGADPDRLDALLGPLARLDLRAVQAGRVAVIRHPLGLTPSSAMIEIAEQLIEKMKRW